MNTFFRQYLINFILDKLIRGSRARSIRTIGAQLRPNHSKRTSFSNKVAVYEERMEEDGTDLDALRRRDARKARTVVRRKSVISHHSYTCAHVPVQMDLHVDM